MPKRTTTWSRKVPVKAGCGILATSLIVIANLAVGAPVIWTNDGAPVQAQITGGPWTLAQGPSSNAFPSKGYCINGARQGNPSTELMQPYYFPAVFGHGKHLQGFFDWRPKNINEAVVTAESNDGGRTWTFQDEALDLRETCPPSDTTDNGGDDGYGHPYVLDVYGAQYLYTLDRAATGKVSSIDNLGLVVNNLTPVHGKPLNGVQAGVAVQDANGRYTSYTPLRTTGLLNPDGIIAAVPGRHPVTVLYLQKIRSGDNTGATTLPASQQCGPQPVTGRKANHDIVIPRLATTSDGVNFADLGPVTGLNDPTTVSNAGTRYMGPRGTVIRLDENKYGLFFSGGNCLDADSDAFHYIGYAESTDLVNWTVVNGINNPIASIASITVPVDGVVTMIPAETPVVGPTQDWFKARIYSPSVNHFDDRRFTLTFAGYQVQSPAMDLAHYRQIGNVMLKVSRRDLDDDDDHARGED